MLFIQVNLQLCSTCIIVPSEAPQNFTIINSNFTSVTVSWNSVDCIHRNGLITHYIILYGPVDETNLVRVNSSRPDDGGRYTATELDATQNYLFKVAAVNSDGIGVFATVSTNKRKLNIDIHFRNCVNYYNMKSSDLISSVTTNDLDTHTHTHTYL